MFSHRPFSDHVRPASLRGHNASRVSAVTLTTLLALLTAAAPSLAVGNPCSGGSGTTIVVNTSADPNPTLLSTDCVPVPADGCSFRRALITANQLPRAERPYNIVFNLPTSDPRYDAATDTWNVLIAAALPTVRDDLATPGTELGCIVIDGINQAGGRPSEVGPNIFLDDGGAFGGWTLPIFSPNNIIKDLGFKGGLVIQLGDSSTDEAHETLIDGVWIGLTNDGQSLELQSPGQPSSLGFGTGIFIDTNDNIIRNSVISGANGKAIDINGGTTNNYIHDNYFGTRSDGTLPLIESTNVDTEDCDASMSYEPADNWYGGWGVSFAGTGNILENNIFAGMQNMRSTNDTAPVAIETFGNDHIISGNTIGEDANGDVRGVCGHAIKISDGQGTDVLDNVINSSRVSFLTSGGNLIDTAIVYNADQFGDQGEVTIRRNLVFNGPGDVIQMGPVVPDALKLFDPPMITNITAGGLISGTTAPGSDCVNCIVDLYTDDNDGIQGAYAWIGSTTVAGNGSFSLNVGSRGSSLLTQGVRATLTTVDSVAIPGFAAGTTTEMGDVLMAPAPSGLIFADGFGSGNANSWSASSP